MIACDYLKQKFLNIENKNVEKLFKLLQEWKLYYFASYN